MFWEKKVSHLRLYLNWSEYTDGSSRDWNSLILVLNHEPNHGFRWMYWNKLTC